LDIKKIQVNNESSGSEKPSINLTLMPDGNIPKDLEEMQKSYVEKWKEKDIHNKIDISNLNFYEKVFVEGLIRENEELERKIGELVRTIGEVAFLRSQRLLYRCARLQDVLPRRHRAELWHPGLRGR
jgi:hypothetical protein